MPFDGTTISKLTIDNRLAIINRMIELIANRRNWTKFRTVQPLPSGDNAYCMVGALDESIENTDTRYDSVSREAKAKLRTEMVSIISSSPMIKETAPRLVTALQSISSFNDNEDTTHRMVMRVLCDVREHVIDLA